MSFTGDPGCDGRPRSADSAATNASISFGAEQCHLFRFGSTRFRSVGRCLPCNISLPSQQASYRAALRFRRSYATLKSVVSQRKKKQSLGEIIVELRRKSGLNQKDLASKIRREDGRIGISAQYLNDIEHDRRTPSGDHLLRELAKALNADPSFLAFLAGQLPPEIREVDIDPKRLKIALAAFRQAATNR